MHKRFYLFVAVACLTSLTLFSGVYPEPREKYPYYDVPKYDIEADYQRWTNFLASYEPNYSDSSHYLEPPVDGRIARAIQITKEGEALGEIVVDLSDEILIENRFPELYCLELRAWRGYERHLARLAANELADNLFKITGADFPVLTEPSPKKNVKIFLGPSFAKKYFADDLKALSSGGSFDGYAVRVKDGNIYLFGAFAGGTLYGVYSFLENNTDIIWGYIGDEGVVYTENKNLSIRWADKLDKPLFIQRGWQGGDPDWKRHNRINFFGEFENGEFRVHGGHYFSPQYYDYSEGMQKFNPVHNGKRVASWDETRHLPCISQPDFFARASEVIGNVKEVRFGNGLYDCVFGVDDNAGVCQCENCRTPVMGRDGKLLTYSRQTHGIFYSTKYYTYYNQIDDALQKVWPGYTTSTFAYFFNNHYPVIDVNKTIVPWFCSYGRPTHQHPISHPKNRGWWKFYLDWMAHSPGTMLYAYYGLGDGVNPLAESHGHELKAQAAIGFLRNSTEGPLGGNDYLGAADERWCVSRLDWNPNVSVEELHRYFNRRVYREAAPWIDRIRGEIRKAYFRADCNRAIPDIMREKEIEPKIKEYIACAVRDVKHPKAKELVAKVAREIDKVLNPKPPTAEEEFEALKRKLKKKGKKVEGVLAPASLGDVTEMAGEDFAAEKIDFGLPVGEDGKPADPLAVPLEPKAPKVRPSHLALMQTLTRAKNSIKAFAESGKKGEALSKYEAFACEHRLTHEEHVELLVSILNLLIEKEAISPEEVISLMHKYYPTDQQRAIGWMCTEQKLPSIYGGFAERYAALGNLAAAEKLFQDWIDWDKEILPIGIREERTALRVAFYRKRLSTIEKSRPWKNLKRVSEDSWLDSDFALVKKHKELTGYADKAIKVWHDDLRRTITDGGTQKRRGNAKWTLLMEEWKTLTPEARLKTLMEIAEEKFNDNHLRRKATEKIPDAFLVREKIDWKAAIDPIVRALASGDWSQLNRSCYTGLGKADNDNDLRLNALCTVAERMLYSNPVPLKEAQELINKGGDAIGYTKDFDPNKVKEYKAGLAPLTIRLHKLDLVREKANLKPINKDFMSTRGKRAISTDDLSLTDKSAIDDLTLDEL